MSIEAVHDLGSVQEVVDDRLCVQCGTCVPVCPQQAITMRETPAGMLVASVQADRCVHCGLCRSACPGADLPVGAAGRGDPFKGDVRRAYAGAAGEEAVRVSGQSGGVASALLLFLFETSRIDAALVTSMPDDGSLRPLSKLARTREEVLSAQGSKYCPAAPCALLGRFRAGERAAVVGIPCQMHGIHKLAGTGSPLASAVHYRIGLFCDRTLLYSCIDEMARQARLGLDSVTGLEYRSKGRMGWPGEVCFHLVSGERRYFPPTLRTSLKEFFTPWRCRLCFDKLNVFSDLAIGDAWGISQSPAGQSVILARSEKGDALVRAAVTQGFLDANEIEAERIFLGQNIEKRRHDFSSFMRLAEKRGERVPEYNGLSARFLKAADEEPDRLNERRLSYSLELANSQSKKIALAHARRWQRRQKGAAFFVSWLARGRALAGRVFPGRRGNR